ncbi:MAG: transglutaminase family protein [Betaproteobacteria bacterium]|nr:transglutaminase family protein [Betaproteobacteria bacterium]
MKRDDTALLQATPLLDWQTPAILHLVSARGWRELPEFERVGAIYRYMRDEIAFGYNERDNLPASRVLQDGYGQCNTKAVLLMALLRAAGIPCRLHGATIHKRLQKGVVSGLFYVLAPENILHTWVEVKGEVGWVALEGVILDQPYLDGVRRIAPAGARCMLGYAVGTDQWPAPAIEWRGTDTAIQQTGVNQDFGVFEDPDAFYSRHGSNLSGFKAWLFRHVVRHLMNRKVAKIRSRRS